MRNGGGEAHPDMEENEFWASQGRASHMPSARKIFCCLAAAPRRLYASMESPRSREVDGEWLVPMCQMLLKSGTFEAGFVSFYGYTGQQCCCTDI